MREHQREMDAFRAQQAPEGDLDAEMQSMLDARNARRRKRGLPDMTLDELKATLARRTRRSARRWRACWSSAARAAARWR